jgi:hypothetical protein
MNGRRHHRDLAVELDLGHQKTAEVNHCREGIDHDLLGGCWTIARVEMGRGGERGWQTTRAGVEQPVGSTDSED